LTLLGLVFLAGQAAGYTESARPSDEAVSHPLPPITFGVYTHIRPTEMLRKIEPLRVYLQNALASRGLGVEIRLRIYPSYTGAIDGLVKGEVDFVRYGPVSYVIARERNSDIRLLAVESNEGRKTFNGVIAVAEHSPIQSIDDLLGKHIAFGDRRSTTGRYLAQAALMDAGIDASKLAGHTYLGRHDKVAFAVAAGNYDAGAFNENTFNQYAASKGLRKILEFPCVTKPWAARAGLDPLIFESLRAALLDLKDSEVLAPINRDGLMPGDDADFDPIRRAIARAGQFDPKSLTFGIYASVRPSDAYNEVEPIIRELERSMVASGSLSGIRIRMFQDYEAAIGALADGDVDFARLGVASFLSAREINPSLKKLVNERSASTPPKGIIVVPADSGLSSINELAGARFAFGDRYSTEGRYLPQAMLVHAGIRADDLAGYSYLGRHDRVASSVEKGIYDAGALLESVYRQHVFRHHEDERRLRVIARFDTSEKLWVGRSDMEDEIFAQLRQGLLDISPGPALAPLGIERFVPSDENRGTDDLLSEQIKRSLEFERTQ